MATGLRKPVVDAIVLADLNQRLFSVGIDLLDNLGKIGASKRLEAVGALRGVARFGGETEFGSRRHVAEVQGIIVPSHSTPGGILDEVIHSNELAKDGSLLVPLAPTVRSLAEIALNADLAIWVVRFMM
jgi:hypothetical protein